MAHPASVLSKFNIEAQHPDEFLLNVIDLAPAKVAHVVRTQAAELKNPKRIVAELLETLREQGLVKSVTRLKELMDP